MPVRGRPLPSRIVGISLVRNEDLFVEQAIRNVLDFCDELLLVDHRSRDRTPQLLKTLAKESPIPTSVHRVKQASASHDLIAPLAGEDLWVFGVDGDEIYDPAGLARFREGLLAGDLADRWLVRGNVLACTELDRAADRAVGYLAPPGPSHTKLYNFSLIERWGGYHRERLHGVEGLRFKPGASDAKYPLYHEYPWEESPFRCLHVCFLRRSSRERTARPRPNLYDAGRPRRAPVRALRAMAQAAGWRPRADFKETYKVGDVAKVSAREFFPESDWRLAQLHD